MVTVTLRATKDKIADLEEDIATIERVQCLHAPTEVTRMALTKISTRWPWSIPLDFETSTAICNSKERLESHLRRLKAEYAIHQGRCPNCGESINQVPVPGP